MKVAPVDPRMRFPARICVGLILCMAVGSLHAATSSRGQDIRRIRHSERVFRSIMKTPDHAIPESILGKAKCIAIIPGQKKFAFGFGGQYGKGLATCRTTRLGWSAPLFIQIGGASWGLQIGGASSDVIMVFMSRAGLRKMLSSKFKIGAGAMAAAGPVGRNVSAATNITLKSKILTYARSSGAFAGISLNGSVVQPDNSGNRHMYGHSLSDRRILSGHVRVPPAAVSLIRLIETDTHYIRAGAPVPRRH